MKYGKIFMLMVAVTLFAACSSDSDSWNSNGEVVVSMANQEITWKENRGSRTPVSVPIAVTGERNGAIEVTVDVAETGTTPAMDDIHYIITSKTIVIPADAEQGKIEVMTVDDDDVNENRTFTMTIKEAKGATISETAATAFITLKDNDSEFYEKLMGGWKLTVNDLYADEGADPTLTWNVNIEGYDEGEEGYNQYLWMGGLNGYDWCYVDLEYHYDMTSKTGHVDMTFPSLAADGVNFGTGYEDCKVYLLPVVDGNLVTDSYAVRGTWNDDFTEITFEDVPVYARIMNNADGQWIGYWFAFSTAKLTKK